jgi:hypothetical protein
MSANKFISKLITSPIRNYSKKKILKKLSSSPQTNTGIVNIHRIDKGNVGDYFCAPHHYFENLNNPIDIYDYKNIEKDVRNHWVNSITTNALIIGGGGLLNRGSFENPMQVFEKLALKGKRTVLWGVGHNSKNKKDFNKLKSYNININNFGLVGTRDYGFVDNYVPCVSCLNTVFDKEYTSTQETGIIFHKKTLKNTYLVEKFKDYPTSSNTTNLEELINFIGKSGTIITDSYHAMYWSILLGKKVAVVPNSSKFFNFKYNPIITSFENCLEDAKKAPQYDGVLEECRDLNMKYYSKVANYLNLS